MGLGLSLWFTVHLLLCYLTQCLIANDTPKTIRHGSSYGSKKNGILSESSNSYADEEQIGDSLEIGISDVKSIIMEKYGRHYRLTGGSTLATKRNKGDLINIDASNTSKEENVSAQVRNSSEVQINQDKNSLLNGTASNVTLIPSNISALNSTVESESAIMINGTRGENADVNKTSASKSDIANVNENEILRDKTIHLDPSKNDSSNVEFGTPPINETLLPKADSENNITAEGNLTTISIDLSKGDTTAVLPALDINISPLIQVDVVYGNSTNAPKRSGTNVTKPKKNIAFEISKPRMVINDFANKRKHVPHRSTWGHAKKRTYRKRSKRIKGTKLFGA